MKKYILAGICALVPSLFLNAQPGWYQKADFEGSARSASSIFAINNKAYVSLGVDSGGYKRSLWEYDPATDNWDQKTSLGGATGSGLGRNVAMSFAIGNKGYIVGGQGSNPYFDDTWEYDALADVWTQKQSFTPGGRRAGVGVAFNGKGYVGLGQDATNALKKDWWEYDPIANTWTSKANYMGTPRRLAAAFAIGTKIYVGTGDDGTFKTDFYEYNPSNNTWTMKAAFGGTARYGTAYFEVGGKGYIGSGYDNTLINRRDFWSYDPTTNMWTSLGDFLGSPRANAVAVGLPSGKAYFGLGYDQAYFNDWWELNPPVGVNELTHVRNVAVYPNPMVDRTTISWSENFSDAIDVVLIDMQGKVIRREQASGQQIELNREGLPAGLYLVQLEYKHQTIGTQRLLVK
jgi:N-acetylneuraminic acid mutarotase